MSKTLKALIKYLLVNLTILLVFVFGAKYIQIDSELHKAQDQLLRLKATVKYEEVQDKIREFGFEGFLGVFDSRVPCKAGSEGGADGCYNFNTNAIFINGTLSGKSLDYIIYHELCHWKLQTYNEDKADQCAFEILDQKELEQAFEWGFTLND